MHDDPLSPTGQSQAAQASTHPHLSQTTLVLVSPLSRAMDTALAIFGDRPNVTLHVTPALREFNLHQREGGPLKERHVGRPLEELRRKYCGGGGGGDSGGGGGDSGGEHKYRCSIVWDDALETPEWWEPHGDAYAREGTPNTAPTCLERVTGLMEALSRGAHSTSLVGLNVPPSSTPLPPPLVIVAHENVFRFLTGTPCFVNCSVVGATLVGEVGGRVAVHVDGLQQQLHHPTVFLPSLVGSPGLQQRVARPLTPVRHVFALLGCDDLELYQARAARAFKEALGCGGVVLGLLATTQFLPAIDDVKARLVAGSVPHSMAYSTFVCDPQCGGGGEDIAQRALFHLRHLGGKWVVHVVTHDFQMPAAIQGFWGVREEGGVVVCIQACTIATPFPLLARIGSGGVGRALGLEGLWGDDTFRNRYVGRWGWGDLLAIGRNLRGGAAGGEQGARDARWWDAVRSGNREGVKSALLLPREGQQEKGGGFYLSPPPGSLTLAAGAGHRDLCLDLICWGGCAAYAVEGGRGGGEEGSTPSKAALNGGHGELAGLLADIAGMQLCQDLRF